MLSLAYVLFGQTQPTPLRLVLEKPPESVILSPLYSSIIGLQLHPELFVSCLGQLVDPVKAKPELLLLVTKPILVISPISVKVLPEFSIYQHHASE